MTNFDKIKNMNKDEMLEFLNKLLDGSDGSIILDWFDKKYCKGICPDIEVIYEGKNEMWKECNFEGNCPYQKDWGENIIKLWLDAESED